MKSKSGELQLRQIGKGFVINQMEGMVGRILTSTFVDQYKQTYVKINGELTLLTEEHGYLAVN